MSTIDITLKAADQGPIAPPAQGFFYVDQGNYQTFVLADTPLTAYSDSATSCIITAVVSSFDNRNTLTLAHLDSPDCIDAFFDLIASQAANGYQVFAQGANPPDNSTAQDNANQLRTRIDQLGSKVARCELALLQGDPRQDNRGDFGVSYSGDGRAVASNQPYDLQLYQRDPTCGGQTVYCIMRRQEQPPVQIRDAGQPFTHAELVELAEIALQFRKDPQDPATAFSNIVNLQSDEIRQNWSTTPAYEAPWFSDQLKLGAAFAIAMAPVVSLSAQHLSRTTPPSFGRLRKALLVPR
ncbi:hypothetical protein [Pseudomonas benzenivorans]|uniref:Uncharacterized protein n=1 Tax=Pseudomonas benzenivorans TaxID=556533 RepID=A0ABY5HB45_9PSED|nr:hypothetical protein [Pseudomonas benzenivorans]UTW08226.1 hypothetical protein KDW96_02540 [Pseudomonas benzenivorans]